MSGPKISAYTLTGRAKEIVFEQMRCERETLACYSQAKEIIQSLQPIPEYFEKQIETAKLHLKRTNDGAEQIKQLRMIQEETAHEAESIKQEIASHVPKISEKIWITEEALAEKRAELKRFLDLKKRAEKLLAKVDDASKQQDQNAISRIQDSIAEDLGGSFSFEPGHEEARLEAAFQEKKEAVHAELANLLSDRHLPESLLKEIKAAVLSLQRIRDLQFLNTFESVTVKGILEKRTAFLRKEEDKRVQYKELLARYEALCAMAGKDVQRFPYSETAFAAISSEIERLELFLVHQQEQAYIIECVDEVMADMGYDLIGSREVRKKSGKQFRHELFTFSEGTAVDVTFSPDGQITMELGGLAREDRIPSADETEKLTRDMESFCGEFAEFERRMLARGIVVGKRIALSPPTAEHATIINVNDYAVAESTQISVMATAGNRRTQAEKKALRQSE